MLFVVVIIRLTLSKIETLSLKTKAGFYTAIILNLQTAF